MPSVDRNNPTRAESSDSDYSLIEFMRQYPDDAACLDRLWRDKYAPDGHHAHCPKCKRERKLHRTKTRASYTCDTCGLHLHPMKGTIFEKSTTSLQLWFYAMYLMASTRCGISAKQVERGGRVRVKVIPSRRGPALSRAVKANVNPASMIFTDDWQAYKPLKYEG